MGVTSQGLSVVELRVENPPGNTLSMAVLAEFRNHLVRLATDTQVRCVILTAGPGPFISGGDVGELLEAVGDAEAIGEHVDLTGELFGILEKLPVPVIAAVDGAAVGGGLEILLCCDLVVARSTARFGLPEVKLGLIPGAGGTQRLARKCGSAFAAEILLTAGLASAAEAASVGLINEVTEGSAEERAREIAERIAGLPPAAVRAARAALRGGATVSLAEGLALERSLFIELMSDPNTKDGLLAFLNRAR